MKGRGDLGPGEVLRVAENYGVYVADVVFDTEDGRRLETLPWNDCHWSPTYGNEQNAVIGTRRWTSCSSSSPSSFLCTIAADSCRIRRTSRVASHQDP